MRVTLIGTGCGPDSLTLQAAEALSRAALAVGADRLLRELDGRLPADCRRVAATRAADIAAALEKADGEAVVLFSGDSGFYSGARLLLPLLAGREVTLLPGVSSLQALAARLGRPWQDWGLFSAHGTACDAVAAVCGGRPAFFLTGGQTGPDTLCRRWVAAGLEDLPVTVGEDLFGPAERVVTGTAGQLAGQTFGPLCVVLAEAAPRPAVRTPGLPDDCFERAEGIPMTKQEIRALALAKLAVRPGEICWDIGAGTGSVAIELALHAGAVWGVEQRSDALELAARNRAALGAWNLRLVAGEAPAALEGLPAPDAVFIGGSGGKLAAIVAHIRTVAPAARVCVAAIAVETLSTAVQALSAAGYETEITQVSVSRSRAVAGLHLMMGQNPVSLVMGRPL